jgi:hypothetical protein
MHDSEQLSKLCADVQALSLAYFSADERYARQAASYAAFS